MERHASAQAARQDLGRVLERLKTEFGIERQKVAELLGVPPPMLSRMSADEVRDRPTFAPPPDWRDTLAVKLDRLGKGLAEFARAGLPGGRTAAPAPSPPAAGAAHRRPGEGRTYSKADQVGRRKK